MKFYMAFLLLLLFAAIGFASMWVLGMGNPEAAKSAAGGCATGLAILLFIVGMPVPRSDEK